MKWHSACGFWNVCSTVMCVVAWGAALRGRFDIGAMCIGCAILFRLNAKEPL